MHTSKKCQALLLVLSKIALSAPNCIPDSASRPTSLRNIGSSQQPFSSNGVFALSQDASLWFCDTDNQLWTMSPTSIGSSAKVSTQGGVKRPPFFLKNKQMGVLTTDLNYIHIIGANGKISKPIGPIEEPIGAGYLETPSGFCVISLTGNKYCFDYSGNLTGKELFLNSKSSDRVDYGTTQVSEDSYAFATSKPGSDKNYYLHVVKGKEHSKFRVSAPTKAPPVSMKINGKTSAIFHTTDGKIYITQDRKIDFIDTNCIPDGEMVSLGERTAIICVDKIKKVPKVLVLNKNGTISPEYTLPQSPAGTFSAVTNNVSNKINIIGLYFDGKMRSLDVDSGEITGVLDASDAVSDFQVGAPQTIPFTNKIIYPSGASEFSIAEFTPKIPVTEPNPRLTALCPRSSENSSYSTGHR